ncbi:DUF4255 domain-containing protein [Xenorhabdus szentirmaii]|uniref:Pvc16 N-terminal domain-containing protein n=2 Tax=Xenorhabdus szentirmaii TaxID=290112 RepID=W1J1R0_9GAMM|nr:MULTISPECIES: DUF4255 domain-containing protein [Xenorhabdus]MBD2781712.1 DUF4255 domain-containing protein [Xenorhabdus sp. 38]MBD2793316.1 DUF4255 domain-containing protein [Xenorhabdus sp. CUL]MBD2801889.1 DUF4255 domain-containing protein [Xenorhabdus sp. M]MBD2805159.1 DUF4255 domain-containing protein [Xenorhabdus sp. ZM]MBD2820099.1 DUF4255 domain-containing protein [Xenorhabdus sp. 42]
MLKMQTVIDANKAMKAILEKYLDKKIAIRFDLPELDTVQSDAMVSVFLYDIHEDLQLRSTESRVFNAASGRLLPGWVNIQCNYLITYWESSKPATDPNSPDSQPDNQAIQVMSQVLKALINNRQLAGIPGAYTQVVPPKESLNSLGSFWQSLGNRPRLSLNYSVTIPISLTDEQNKTSPINTISSTVEQTTSLNQEMISHALRELLITELKIQPVAELESEENIRLALSKVGLLTMKETKPTDNSTEVLISLSVSGITHQKYLQDINKIFEHWLNANKIVTTIDNDVIRINHIEKNDLIGI